MKIPQEVIDLIQSGCPAHLVTLNSDGSPQVTLVWIGLEGADLDGALAGDGRFGCPLQRRV